MVHQEYIQIHWLNFYGGTIINTSRGALIRTTTMYKLNVKYNLPHQSHTPLDPAVAALANGIRTQYVTSIPL